ncbi:conserved protein of unknown function [Rhodovastum atsumiense]|uniref:Uncharacterized protein n=1 Tax=Rhodovastum atsumiense TaxID=504468 RepID=A0A5M6IQW5_9PROT|nr:hypothetical protein [Rhodovastum atsumiense]KAA5609865.1 hypothetical protein F1189_22000 [Rhodovastum atsumiense]CAH2602435.1 conserved protein of unknown function [Rhodovastum atsumiense]
MDAATHKTRDCRWCLTGFAMDADACRCDHDPPSGRSELRGLLKTVLLAGMMFGGGLLLYGVGSLWLQFLVFCLVIGPLAALACVLADLGIAGERPRRNWDPPARHGG